MTSPSRSPVRVSEPTRRRWPPFELARHHRAIIDLLERIERGEITRAIIQMPPRYGKSLISSQIFPCWYLGRHPDRNIIGTSYGQELATDFGRKVRNFMLDPVHTAIFPEALMTQDSQAVHHFTMVRGGEFYAVGMGGALTGRGADLVIIDDRIKSADVTRSAVERKNMQDWYQSVLYTRLQPGGAILMIQTRWHEADLAGCACETIRGAFHLHEQPELVT
jgi:hypothetical protein